MNKEVVTFIKFLYDEKTLSMNNIEKAFDFLESEKHITNYESKCDFEENLSQSIIDFKCEILDALIILLSQLKEIEDVKNVLQKLKIIQAMLATFKERIEESKDI